MRLSPFWRLAICPIRPAGRRDKIRWTFSPRWSTLLWTAPHAGRRRKRATRLEKTVSFCGRVLTASELSLVRQIIADFPCLSQAELAHTICELLEWRRPNGKLKSPECMEWLQKLQERTQLPALPDLRLPKPGGAHRFHPDPQADPQPPLRGRLADYQPLRLQLIEEPADRH